MSDAILGISAFYHDSAAALIVNGEIFAAAQEERFTRIKHDSSFPSNAIGYVLDEAGLSLDDLSGVAFYEKPFVKFERLLETYHAFAPKGLKSFFMAVPIWIKEKLFMKKMLHDELSKFGAAIPSLYFPEHHLSHAASAFYPSPYQESAILTIDGVGEWATATIGHGIGNKIEILRELTFPHSLGLLYSAFTYYCGFRVNSGEYKLMGLAPYGNPESEQLREFIDKIRSELVDIKPDGSILLNMEYFNYATGLTMCNDKKWEALFGIPKRDFESELTQSYMNLALAIQDVTEDIVFRLSETAKEITGCRNLVLSGGVALNCVANGKLLRKDVFDDIWIQPAAGDAGGSLGAALAVWHILKGKERSLNGASDLMKGSYLGPLYSENDVRKTARKFDAPYTFYEQYSDLCRDVADIISQGKIVGWFQGRMEFGPRALGNRSILGDTRFPEMQKKLNLKIKYRESFRPFAPSVIEEDIGDYFELDKSSPYMLLVAPVKKVRINPYPDGYLDKPLYDRLYFQRSDVPAITHIDYSARIQSVSKKTNPRYWELINFYKEKTGYGLLVNTSFNVRGEPIVCSPTDAYLCFMRTEMDYLVLNNFLFKKEDQPELIEKDNWRTKYKLD